jgi:SAM domain (Sterile alpha motif)/Glycine-zipper domain
MAPKSPSEFSIDEVAMWLVAIGLGSKAPEFKENGIDGPMLVALSDQDLQTDLGLQNLQLRKFRVSLDFSNGLSEGGGADPARMSQLEAENYKLKKQVADLQAIIDALQQGQTQSPYVPAAQPKPAPPPQQYTQYRPQPAGRPVVRGAAGGAARGALLGAVGGAIAGDAAAGAKMGAAMGATAGGMRGLGERRRMQRY